MHVPSFAMQQRLDDRIRCVLWRLKGDGDNPPPEAELALDAVQVLSAWHREVGPEFWCALPPVAPLAAEAGPAPAGLGRVWLSDGQKRETEGAFWWAMLHEIPSVLGALRAYAAQRMGMRQAPSIRVCVEEWTAEREAARLQQPRKPRAHLRAFIAEFGERPPAEVTPADLERFLAQGSEIAARTWASHVTRFYHWAIRRLYAVENPVAPARLRRAPPRRFIFTPRQARYILRTTRETDQIGYWVLSFFAGLRTSEIVALEQQPLPWRAVHFRLGELHVPSGTTGEPKRIVTMSPILQAWLRWLRPKQVPFFPRNFWEKRFPHLWKTALRTFPDQRTARTGYKNPGFPRVLCGVGRATHLAYRVALPKRSIDQIAVEVGVSVEIVRRQHDPTLARRAQDFFALWPDRL